MKVEENINVKKRIAWINKRTELTDQQKDLIEYQMKDAVIEAVQQASDALSPKKDDICHSIMPCCLVAVVAYGANNVILKEGREYKLVSKHNDMCCIIDGRGEMSVFHESYFQ